MENRNEAIDKEMQDNILDERKEMQQPGSQPAEEIEECILPFIGKDSNIIAILPYYREQVNRVLYLQTGSPQAYWIDRTRRNVLEYILKRRGKAMGTIKRERRELIPISQYLNLVPFVTRKTPQQPVYGRLESNIGYVNYRHIHHVVHNRAGEVWLILSDGTSLRVYMAYMKVLDRLEMAKRYLAHYEGYLLDMAEREGGEKDVQACLRRKEEIEKRTKRKR